MLSVPKGGFPGGRRRNPRAARRPAAAAGRNGRLQPRLGRSALCPVPGRDRRSRRGSWSGPGEREAIVPGVSYIGDGRADVMRGEEVQLLGAVAAGLVDPDGARLPPGHAQQMGDAAARQDPRFPHGHDRRAVQPAEGAQHPRRPAAGRGRSRTTRSSEGVRARASRTKTLPAELFAVRARVLLGQANKEDAPSYASGLLIGTDVRIGLSWPTAAQVDRHGPAGAHAALRRGHRRGRPRGRSSSTANDASSPASSKSRRGFRHERASDLLHRYLDQCPLVAIIRGVTPDEAEAIGEAIFDAGIRIIEVPLNSPEPLKSIEKLAAAFGDRALVGAGTVLDAGARRPSARAGGRLIVSPNTNTDVIAAAASAGLVSMPRLFHAVRSLRGDPRRRAPRSSCFPPRAPSPAVLKAQLAVIPKDVPILVVGGVSPDNMRPWLDAGATGLRPWRRALQARPVGRRDRRQGARLCRRAASDEADPDRDHRLRQDRRRPACAVDRRQSAVRAGRDLEPLGPGRRAETFTDWRELIRSVEGLEAVAITTPPGPRYEIARECIARRASLPARKAADRRPRRDRRPRLPCRGAAASACSRPGTRSTMRPSTRPPRRSPASASSRWPSTGTRTCTNGIRASNGSGSRAGSACSIPASTLSRSRPRSSPAACSCKSADLSVPENAQTPIAAEIAFSSPEADGAAHRQPRLAPERGRGMDDRGRDRPTARQLRLEDGGSRLLLDGEPQPDDGPGEYPDIYRTFVDLIDERRSLVDVAPAAPGRRLPAGRPPDDRRSGQRCDGATSVPAHCSSRAGPPRNDTRCRHQEP